jgi:hypothetical protein
MVPFRKRPLTAAPALASSTGQHSAVETIRDGGQATRTHVQYAPLFVLAQDYDDALHSLKGALDPASYSALAYLDQSTLALFASVGRVIADIVARGAHISRLTLQDDPQAADHGTLEALTARQFTEQALVSEGLAAIGANIAALRSRMAEARVSQRAQSAQQLFDVAPYPQVGSAAAELSVLLSSNAARRPH